MPPSVLIAMSLRALGQVPMPGCVLWILFCVPSPHIGDLEFAMMSYLEPTLTENVRVFLGFSVTV